MKAETIIEYVELKLFDFKKKALDARQLSDQVIVKDTIDQLLVDISKTKSALDEVKTNE